jgi:secondary thiamine-phosphate synthase enzyme
MTPFVKSLNIRSKKSTEIIDITDLVANTVTESKITEGSLLVFTPHTTTAITINENESGLLEDLPSQLLKLVPKGVGYRHDRIDRNAHAHILASLIGPSVLIPVQKGALSLGTWQSVLFVELDGPRSRNVTVQVD